MGLVRLWKAVFNKPGLWASQPFDFSGEILTTKSFPPKSTFSKSFWG